MPLLVLPLQTNTFHSGSGQQPQTPTAHRDEQVKDTHKGEGQREEEGGEVLMAEDRCMTDICP